MAREGCDSLTVQCHAARVKQVTTLVIALALTLVCDKAFNRGSLTVKLFDSAAGARDWALHSGDEVADSMSGYGRS